MQSLITLNNLRLNFVLSVFLIVSCVKKIDYKDLNQEQLKENLCRDTVEMLDQCESDLLECNKDMLDIIR